MLYDTEMVNTWHGVFVTTHVTIQHRVNLNICKFLKIINEVKGAQEENADCDKRTVTSM